MSQFSFAATCAALLLMSGVAAAATHPLSKDANRTKWFSRFDGSNQGTFYGLPAFGGPNLTFVCANNVVLALQLSNGAQLWSFTADFACQYIDTSTTSVVVATNASVYALSIYSGYKLWEYSFGNPSPAVPARPTIVNNYVFFTVENGAQSTPLQVLSLATGKLVYSDPLNELVATTRLWYLNDLQAILYVQVNTRLAPGNQQLVLRSVASPPFAPIWTRNAPPLDLANGGGTVAFISEAILAMVQQNGTNNAGIAAFDAATGNTLWEQYQWSQTNNFDFSSTTDPNGNPVLAYTLEAFGDYTQSTLTAYAANDGTQLWATNLTAGVPDLLPAGPRRVLACGNNTIVALDTTLGAIAWSVPFPNSNEIIGNSYKMGNQWIVVIGNTAAGGIYCYFAE